MADTPRRSRPPPSKQGARAFDVAEPQQGRRKVRERDREIDRIVDLPLQRDRTLAVLDGPSKIFAVRGDRGEVRDRDPFTHGVAELVEHHRRFLVPRLREREVALRDCHRAELGEAPRRLAVVSVLAVDARAPPSIARRATRVSPWCSANVAAPFSAAA